MTPTTFEELFKFYVIRPILEKIDAGWRYDPTGYSKERLQELIDKKKSRTHELEVVACWHRCILEDHLQEIENLEDELNHA